ncbi:MAG: type II secretion system protein GspD [Thermocrinis sp.]|jgi:general secretion pathway protein D|uniref:type II secretion system protein GspD n=1 Tax=Thermocrinis sp. TaxID=2024383 RepID=UPI003C0546A5
MRKGWVIFSLALAGTVFAGRYDPVPVEYKRENGFLTIKKREEEKEKVLNTPVSVNVRNVSLTYLASLLSQYVKVPIVLRDIAYPQQVQAGQGGQTQAQSEYFTLSYFADGKPLHQVLDEITGMFDLWWKYEGGRIVIYKYEARVFNLRLPFLQKRIEEKNGSLTLIYQREFTKNLEASLQRLLRDSGSKVSVDEMGNVYVFGMPSEVRAIENAVSKINENFTKPIPLKVKVYLVSDRDFMSLGLSLNITSGSVSSSFSSDVIGAIFTLSVATSRIEAQLNALAQSGKASLIEESVLTALNGQPMVYSPLQKQRIISRFDLSFVAPTGDGGPSVATPTITMQTEDIQTGSMLIIVPYFVNEDTIAVDLYRRQDSLERLETRKVNLSGFENEVALPLVSTRTNLNQTLLRKGETLVLFTSAQTLERFRDSGIPFLKDIPILGYLFSSKEKVKELYRLVITMEFM